MGDSSESMIRQVIRLLYITSAQKKTLNHSFIEISLLFELDSNVDHRVATRARNLSDVNTMCRIFIV